MGISEDEIPTTPEEILEATEISGRTEEVKYQRAEAVLAAYEFLQREGSATISEIQEYTHQRYDFDQPTEGQTAKKRQWVLYLRDALKELPGVEASSAGSTWTFIEPGSELDQMLDQEVDNWILNQDEIDIGGNEESVKRQQVLIQMAYDYLKEEGEAQRSDFEEVLPDYTAHYNDFDGFWMYTLRKVLAIGPGVESPTQGSAVFRYHGEDQDNE